MHCFQGKGSVIYQKGPLQVQANFHFFLFWCCKHTCATFWAYRHLSALSWGVNYLKKLLMLGWLWKDILWACQALLISTRSTPPPSETKQKRFVTRATTRSFFWRQKVWFWGKTFVTEVQKSFICPIKDRFDLQPEFINEPFVALRYNDTCVNISIYNNVHIF